MELSFRGSKRGRFTLISVPYGDKGNAIRENKSLFDYLENSVFLAFC